MAKSDTGTGTESESELHQEIVDYCGKQFPKWKYRHSRMDRATREEVGVEDFTVFLPGGKTVHIECKSKGGKISLEQLAWGIALNQLGHEVKVVKSFDQFLQACGIL